MFGWSIIASAWRSASNRATTCLGVHAELDDLERHAPPHRLGLLGHIHHTATAYAESLQQLVASERLAHGFVGRIGEIELDGRTRHFSLCSEQFFGLFVGRKKRFEASMQFLVIAALAVQPRCAL